MKVVQVCGPFRPDRGGIARVVAALSEGLRKRGHDVSIVSAIDEQAEAMVGAEAVIDPPRFRPALLQTVIAHKPDIVHVHCYSSWLPLNIMALRLLGYPVVFTPEFHPWGSRPRWKRTIFDMFVGNLVFRGVNAIHTLTVGESDTIEQRFGIRRAQMTVISAPLPRRFLAAGDFPRGRPPGPRALLFVGRVDDRKGLEFLLRAQARLEADPSFGDLQLKIVGDVSDPYADEVRRLVRELGLLRTEIVGGVSDTSLDALYRQASALILPSSYESFGMVLIEAMASGCPVIGTSVGGIPWVVADGENGLLVPYGDAAALEAAIRKLLADPALSMRLAILGASTVLRFDQDRVALRMEGMYKRVLAKSRARTG